ncbi:MAG: hypothetical protein ABIB79_02065 [archaeon]
MEYKSLEVLIRKFPTKGMSRKCQEFIPRVLNQYFQGRDFEILEKYAGNKNKTFVRQISHVMNQIRINSAKKVGGYFGQHHEDLKEDVPLADAIIKYSLLHKSDNGILNVFNCLDDQQRTIIEKRYLNDEKINVQNELKTLARKPEFYSYMLDDILD